MLNVDSITKSLLCDTTETSNPRSFEGEGFASIPAKIWGMYNCTPAPPVPSPLIQCIVAKKKENKCQHSHCGKMYKSEFSLKRHLATAHNDDRKHECEFCGKRFALNQYLKDHRNIHTGQRPYKCKFSGCGQSF